jgi:arylsulfatase A-like enzyme
VDYEGRIGDSFDLEGFSRVRDSMFVQMQDLSQADWHRIVALYDGEIAFTDSAIAGLLGGLDSRNLTENTLIVFLSDHGEEFFEHGGFEHGHSLYQELIHVPLLFALPGKLTEGARISRPVRLLDVAPTILDFLDIDPPPDFEGVSIKPLLTGGGQPQDPGNSLIPRDLAYAEALMHGREKKCIVAYPWKLVYEMGTEAEQLFNLAEDPGEVRDVYEDEPARAARLNDLLFRVLFGISDTWYVEIAAGDAQAVFDIDIVAEKGPMPGSINVCRLLDDSGHCVDVPGVSSLERSGSRLRLRDLRL